MIRAINVPKVAASVAVRIPRYMPPITTAKRSPTSHSPNEEPIFSLNGTYMPDGGASVGHFLAIKCVPRKKKVAVIIPGNKEAINSLPIDSSAMNP